MGLGVAIGAITFSGSVIAFLKLNGNMSGKPILLPLRHAINLGILEHNPWHEVKVLAKVKESAPTQHYTLEEAEDCISALVDNPDGQLIFALAFFLGLRPGEIAGLKWSDVDVDWLHIRRAFVAGVIGETPPESVASLPLIQPARGMFVLWRARSLSSLPSGCFSDGSVTCFGWGRAGGMSAPPGTVSMIKKKPDRRTAV